MKHIDLSNKLRKNSKKYELSGDAKVKPTLPEEFIAQNTYNIVDVFLAIEEKLNTYYKLNWEIIYYYYGAERFEVVLSETANNDIENMAENFMQGGIKTLTGYRYMVELMREMMKLKPKADKYQSIRKKNLFPYGSNLRKLNYKKSSVIFTIISCKVYIFRIIPLTHTHFPDL